RAPQIPRGDASIRLPADGEVAHRVNGGTRPIEIVDADGFLQSDVIDRQHVGAKLVEDEEHLGGPSSDALDVGQRLDQRLVVERRPRCRIKFPGHEMPGEVSNVFGLALGHTAAAKRPTLRPAYPSGIEMTGLAAAAGCIHQPLHTRLSRLAGDLAYEDTAGA